MPGSRSLGETADIHRRGHCDVSGLVDRNCRQFVDRAHVTTEMDVSCIRIQCQIVFTVQRRGEANRAIHPVIVRIAVYRHIDFQIHRTAECHIAVVAVVGRTVQVDVRSSDAYDTGCRNGADIDLATVHHQARQPGGAADIAAHRHAAAVGVQRQRLTAVDRRGERDVAVGAAAVLVAVHRHVGMKVHRTGELDVAAVRLVDRPVQVDVGALDVDLAGGLHAVEVDLPAVHRQAGQLGGAARRTLEIHRTAVGVQRQRVAAVHRRGERDAAVRAAAVLVAVHRHVGMKVHRTGELDVAAVRLVDRPVQVDVGALDVDLAGGLHALEVDLPAVHRQAGQLGGAARRTLEIHRTAVGVQRQRVAAVDRRGERDAAVRASIVRVAVHSYIGSQGNCVAKFNIAIIG